MEHSLSDKGLCTCRGKMVAEKLYECRTGITDYCEHKIFFGNGYYCSLLLEGHTDRVDHKVPRGEKKGE